MRISDWSSDVCSSDLLKGKLDGSAIRVPTPNVSIVDLTFTPKRDTSVEEINSLLKAASESGPLKGVLAYTDEPLVSIDFNHWPASSTVDSLETAVIDGKLVRVLSWYDNEWGFSNRMRWEEHTSELQSLMRNS